MNVRDIESTLDNVVFLYGYISEKDVFERDYQIVSIHLCPVHASWPSSSRCSGSGSSLTWTIVSHVMCCVRPD